MSVTYFISGHQDLTQEEFDLHYKDRILEAVKTKASFVVGDARGGDSFGQKWLSYLCRKTPDLHQRVTVYHMYQKPRNNLGKFQTQGGFKNDDERDEAMTNNSTVDILWVRTPEEQQKRLGPKYNPFHVSGTMKNQIRRDELNQ